MKAYPILSSLALALGLATLAPTAAATPCKGLTEAVCGETQACRWVQPYTRSDGRAVNGYCRARPAGRAQVSAPVPTSSDG